MKYILKNKFIVAFTIFVTQIFCLSAQNTNYYNQQKYWYYRSRLVNDFVKVGLNAGESLPFNQRAIYQNGDPRVSGNSPGNALHIGDGTSTLKIKQ